MAERCLDNPKMSHVKGPRHYGCFKNVLPFDQGIVVISVSVNDCSNRRCPVSRDGFQLFQQHVRHTACINRNTNGYNMVFGKGNLGLLRIRLLPLVGQLLNGARYAHGLQGLQRIQDDAPLAFHIARFSEHAAPRELDAQGPRRLDLGHPLGLVAHGDGADPGFLCQALNQTHGLMALGSDRHQEEDVDPWRP